MTIPCPFAHSARAITSVVPKNKDPISNTCFGRVIRISWYMSDRATAGFRESTKADNPGSNPWTPEIHLT